MVILGPSSRTTISTTRSGDCEDFAGRACRLSSSGGAALRGIQSFVNRAGCLAVTEIERLPTQAAPPDDESLQALAAKSSQSPERVVLIVVRELGPRITIGIPVIIQGQTEVLIDVRVLSIQPHESLARAQTFWRNGGIFVVKGVKTLDQDMSTALMAALMLTAEAK